LAPTPEMKQRCPTAVLHNKVGQGMKKDNYFEILGTKHGS